MGEVWLAYDEELDDRPVAIKIMHSRMLADSDDVARFQREMRLASRMQHPNIMTLFTTGTDNGVPFMVMEYLDGEDLSKAPPNADPGRVAQIGRDTCAALAYAHGLGVIHRDIKPSNLFLCSTGLVKVTDFGIARAVAGTKLSSTGVLVGTVSYMAPEQWLGGLPELSNDIWATGCVLYELLSRRLPRDYPTPPEYVAAAARRERVPPLNPGSAPPWLANAVVAMLEPDPRNRPAAAECVDLLAGRAGWASLAPQPPMPGPERVLAPAGPPASPRPRPPARRRIALTATALALAAAGGTAAAFALHSSAGTGNAIGVGTTKPTVGTSAPVGTPSATTGRPSALATTTAAGPATGSQSAPT
jgi:serine/threonine-protein kinase